MADGTPGRPSGWTDTEKLGFILQLVNKLDKIPWDELELPPGRTRKACQVMLDREKGKIRRAKENGDVGDGETPSKKRTKDIPQAGPSAKKARATKKAVPKVKEEDKDEHEQVSNGDDTPVYSFDFE